MALFRLPYTVTDRDRHGNVRHYVRRKGKKVRLPGLPGSPEFMKAYHAAVGPTAELHESVEGSLRAACIAYYASADFRRLDASTQAWRRRSLDEIASEHGHKSLAGMRPKHIRAIREKLADTPAAANHRLKALRALFAWATEAELVQANPAKEVRLIRYHSDGHATWSPTWIAAYRERHALGTKARLALELLLYTTGRREDAVRLGPKHLCETPEGLRLRFVQAKNEHRKPVSIDIPVHPDLQAAITGTPSGDLPFLVTEYGKPYTPAGFGNWFRERCNEAGVSGSAHGLRKAGASFMAENGATPAEIMAVTGHQTLAEVERYTRAANRGKLAERAVSKIKA